MNIDRRVLAAFLVMEFYIGLLLLGGVYAFVSAPPEANRMTAIIIPGACAALMQILSIVTLIRRQHRGRPALPIAAVFALLFALLFMMPAMARTKAFERYPTVKAEWDAAVAAGTVENTPATRDAFFREPPSAVAAFEQALTRGEVTADDRRTFMRQRNAPDHDITYLIRTLWGLKIASWVAGLALFVLTLRTRGEAAAPA